MTDHLRGKLAEFRGAGLVLCLPLAVPRPDDRGGAMDPDEPALRGDRLQDAIGKAHAADGRERLVTRHHRSAACLDNLQVNGFGSVCDVDQYAQAIHRIDQCFPIVRITFFARRRRRVFNNKDSCCSSKEC